MRKGQGEATRQSCVVRTADGRADMDGSTEEDYKEKLLWNVKREVGAVWRHSELHICISAVIFDVIIHLKMSPGGSEVFIFCLCRVGLNSVQVDNASLANWMIGPGLTVVALSLWNINMSVCFVQARNIQYLANTSTQVKMKQKTYLRIFLHY